jgi:hypothetical protein
MSLASVEFIRESVSKILVLLDEPVDNPTNLPDMTLLTFLMAGSTVGEGLGIMGGRW